MICRVDNEALHPPGWEPLGSVRMTGSALAADGSTPLLKRGGGSAASQGVFKRERKLWCAHDRMALRWQVRSHRAAAPQEGRAERSRAVGAAWRRSVKHSQAQQRRTKTMARTTRRAQNIVLMRGLQMPTRIYPMEQCPRNAMRVASPPRRAVGLSCFWNLIIHDNPLKTAR